MERPSFQTILSQLISLGYSPISTQTSISTSQSS